MTEPIITPQAEALLAEFNRSGVRELHVRTPDFEIYLSKNPASRATIQQRSGRSTTAPTPAAPLSARDAKPASTKPTPAAAAPAADLPADAIIVRAPNIGTFYGAPKPGAEAYVRIGSTVSVGDELCLIEVMKLFTALRADVDGQIHAILAADGEMVEAGQPLFAIVRN